MSIFDEALERLGELANEVYDDQQLDNKIGDAIDTTAKALHDLRQRVGAFLDRFDRPDEIVDRLERLEDTVTGPQVPDDVMERLERLEASPEPDSSSKTSKPAITKGKTS